MITIEETIIVEGTYDKQKLKDLVDTQILTTEGFDIYKNGKKLQLIRLCAQKNGVVILTDSDSAGFRIRNFLKGALPVDAKVLHAYIPEVLGKEKRKRVAGKEGLLGVEGMALNVLREALKKAGCTLKGESEFLKKEEITKAILFEDGLIGGTDSGDKRKKLLTALKLPSKMSTNAMLEYLNRMEGFEGYKKLMLQLFS